MRLYAMAPWICGASLAPGRVVHRAGLVGVKLDGAGDERPVRAEDILAAVVGDEL